MNDVPGGHCIVVPQPVQLCALQGCIVQPIPPKSKSPAANTIQNASKKKLARIKHSSNYKEKENELNENNEWKEIERKEKNAFNTLPTLWRHTGALVPALNLSIK
jgi:hypothetical protein